MYITVLSVNHMLPECRITTELFPNVLPVNDIKKKKLLESPVTTELLQKKEEEKKGDIFNAYNNVRYLYNIDVIYFYC